MQLVDWKAKGTYFTYKNQSIFYVQAGQNALQPDKAHVLLIHGFPTSSWDWHKVWQPLTEKFVVTALDMIGFGYSAKPYKYHYNIHDQASLHEALLTELGIKKCHILAHDYGDTVAQEMLAAFLDRAKQGTLQTGVEIQSLCLLNGGLFPETHQPRTIQKMLISPLGVWVTKLMNKKRFSQKFSEVFGTHTQPTSQELDDFWQLISLNNGHKIGHKLIRYMNERKVYRERWVGGLKNSIVPIRLINGPADPVSGKHMVARYKEVVNNPDVVMLDDGIGHYPQVEDPEGVLQAFLAFAKR
ncbi:alpha/beta fold hydrolase [Microscilla marina]|uniref:Alpha/beta hydrolase fold n=1 Tax=Microscilla marina ATCC 23134 TaxID=313606 RepID=A2A0L9_MICM2|nr:alpha/beta hydrolase [Microscilla marina]EAY23819.1 alpha/beta hydrolase fold [Microscilla marina ATCC 23134]